MTLQEFLGGAPRYDLARSSGPAWSVILQVVLIFLAGQAAALLLAAYGLPGGPRGVALPGGPSLPSASDLLRLALVSQMVIVALTLTAVSRAGRGASLRLVPPDGGNRVYGLSLVCMVPLILVFNIVAYLIAPGHMEKDFKAFLELARSDAVVPAALAIGFGAPLSEELLFRGFLLSSLTATSLGYWPAAIVATTGWTLLHFNYSWVGLLEVFLIGIYFSWLVWRTGSLLPAIFCHAVYNSALLALLRLLPA